MDFPVTVTVVDPLAAETGLNQALAATTAPFLLPVAAEDQIDPAAVQRLAQRLAAAPSTVAATGETRQVRQDGGLRAVLPASFGSAREVLRASRLPTPVLFVVEHLRAVGGWRPGEANWGHRPWRHRGLLARLVARGLVLGCPVLLGTVARPTIDPDMYHVLSELLLHRVDVYGPALRATGRVAAVTPHLLTLATGEDLQLIPLERVTAVSPASW